MSSRNLTIGVIVVLVVLALWYFMQSQETQAPTPSPQASPQEKEEATDEAEVEEEDEAMEKNVVTVSSTGFAPKEITIKAGGALTWMNEDSDDHQVNSAPHPTHTTYKPLNNVGLLKAGEKKSLTFPEAGTYKYHDHLNPSLAGSVVVE